jgi:hypothetical protein
MFCCLLSEMKIRRWNGFRWHLIFMLVGQVQEFEWVDLISLLVCLVALSFFFLLLRKWARNEIMEMELVANAVYLTPCLVCDP